MKIAVAQIQCKVGDVQANVDKILNHIERASLRGAQLIVFPEMADTGYDVAMIAGHASSWSHGPLRQIRKSAEKNNIYVVCGLSEIENQNLYNALAVIGPEGRVAGKYRKVHLAAFSPLHEDRIFTAGGGFETVQIGEFKCGLMICYDLRFPEMARRLVLNGAQMLLLSSAWPLSRRNHWNTLIAARAIENQVFFAAANHAGGNSSLSFCGSSMIVDPFGITVSSASVKDEMIIEGDIDKAELAEVRKAIPVFEHRRESLYFDAKGRKHPE